MEKFEHIVQFYNQLPQAMQKETISNLKELKALVYDEVEVPELEGDSNLIIRKTLLRLDYILGDEMIEHDDVNFKRIIELKEHLINLLTTDYSQKYSYGSILTFSHYLNYILFVVVNFEHYLQETNK
ncbi:hypothetical protein R2F61_01705 [Mollicutes bacterium LVI A0078]|nr:hypothetical protein RZE84_01700 [Mollicutes bacterium LVI A0075]WOO91291.1 hypothetical protein R2F61_01705 [Mollicutes bacterium LVI A0078]